MRILTAKRLLERRIDLVFICKGERRTKFVKRESK